MKTLRLTLAAHENPVPRVTCSPDSKTVRLATEIKDAGLELFEGLTGSMHLPLKCTDVTDDSVQKLQSSLPKCRINRTVTIRN